MNLDIANMVINVGQVSKEVDWGNFWTALFAAGFGAYGAYLFNIKQIKNQQKDIEKSQLLQLFYDLNILSKYVCRYVSNTKNLAENICNGSVPYNTPLTMDPETIDIEKLGFITLKSNKMYEILSHTRMELMTIFEQGVVYNEAVIRKKKDTLMQLIAICILAPKLITMLYVSLFNVNSMLMKYYNSKNLITDNILNNLAEMLEIIDNIKKEYQEVINNDSLICLYTGEKYTQEQKEGIKEDLEYIGYVLKEWILDFGLSQNAKQNIEKDIKNTLIKLGEDPANDL